MAEKKYHFLLAPEGRSENLKKKKEQLFLEGHEKKQDKYFFFQIEGGIRVKKNPLPYKRALSKKNKNKR